VKFLVDECLSPDLVMIARSRGYGESTHVTWLGLRSRKDWAIVRRAIADGYVLVTNNATDFMALLRREKVHAGLVCINVRICERLGVKFPGPTRQIQPTPNPCAFEPCDTRDACTRPTLLDGASIAQISNLKSDRPESYCADCTEAKALVSMWTQRRRSHQAPRQFCLTIAKQSREYLIAGAD
jgi:predicted nuclease of predicted toxin-antitoxin system